MYRWMVWLETLPAVDTKNDRVHIDGIRLRVGYFSLKILELYPLSQNIASLGDNVGGQFKNKCTWSGMISSASISQPSSLAFWRKSFLTSFSIVPVNTFLRRVGQKTK